MPASAATTRPPIRIDPRCLLAIYALMPLGFVLMVADAVLLGSWIQSHSPTDPTGFLWFTLLLTLPHILASFFGFCEREYVREYGRKLLRGARIVAVATVALMLMNVELAFAVFALLTMNHVFMQQAGISRSLMRGATSSMRYWQWCGIALSTGVYLGIYADWIAVRPLVVPALGVLTIAYLFFGALSAAASRSAIGTAYFWATLALPLAAMAFVAAGYPVLAIAIPRLIHDLTGFVYYIVHDANRFAEARGNVLYRATERIGLPVLVACPAMAVLICLPIQYSGEPTAFAVPILFAFLFHYWVESFMWKRDSLHRRQIRYVPVELTLRRKAMAPS